MKVAVLSYPMLFQTRGGLNMKLQRTVDALNGRGVKACLIDPVRERLTDYDLVHLFAGYNGNYRVVQQAQTDGVPLVLSTILNPPFSQWEGRLARLLTRAVGRLSGWTVTTSYGQLATALAGADHLIVLGSVERTMLIDGYRVPPDKISIVHNGIGHEFFQATPDIFRERFPQIPQRFVLHPGIIGDVKNQLGLVRALSGTDTDIVLIGYAGRHEAAYLSSCLAEGAGRVHYLGELPHGELMASAYAAASIVAIPSRHEGMPNSVLEALAADRPVILTNNHTIDFDLPSDVALEVAPDDHSAIRRGVLGFSEHPPKSGHARAVVAAMSWEGVAAQIESIYQSVLSGRKAADGSPAPLQHE
jgi:hypothetical protein